MPGTYTVISEKFPNLRIWNESEQNFIRFQDGIFETDDEALATFAKTRVSVMEGKPTFTGKMAGRFQPMEPGLAGSTPNTPAAVEEEPPPFEPATVLNMTVTQIKETIPNITEVTSIQQAIMLEENRDDGHPRSTVISLLKEREAILK